jgi:hypothetical protein
MEITSKPTALDEVDRRVLQLEMERLSLTKAAPNDRGAAARCVLGGGGVGGGGGRAGGGGQRGGAAGACCSWRWSWLSLTKAAPNDRGAAAQCVLGGGGRREATGWGGRQRGRAAAGDGAAVTHQGRTQRPRRRGAVRRGGRVAWGAPQCGGLRGCRVSSGPRGPRQPLPRPPHQPLTLPHPTNPPPPPQALRPRHRAVQAQGEAGQYH